MPFIRFTIRERSSTRLSRSRFSRFASSSSSVGEQFGIRLETPLRALIAALIEPHQTPQTA